MIILPIELLLAATLLARTKSPVAPDGTARAIKISALVVGVALVGRAWTTFYSRDMGALTAFYGLDGGSHVGYRHQFIKGDPHTYFGFVSLYSASHLLDRLLPLAPGGSLAICFYSAIAMVAVAPVVVMATVLQELSASRWARLAGLAAFFIVWLFALEGFVLPILANMQVDGFYGHLFGFLPFTLVWVADVLFRPILLRLFWVGLAAMLCRFTYGLNLPDLLITCGALWMFDAWRGRRRIIPILAGAGAIGAAALGYRALSPSFLNGGYVEVYPLADLLKAMLPSVLTLALYGIISTLPTDIRSRSASSQAPMELSRAVRLPIIFALVALIAHEQLVNIPRCESYYPLKHPLMPLVGLAAAACISIGYATSLAFARRGGTIVTVAGIAMVLIIGRLSGTIDQIFSVLRVELEERNTPPPHAKLRPLVDDQTWKMMDKILKTEHKAFGSYVTRDFPIAHFLNSWLGFQNQDQLFIGPTQTPGQCVFWTHATDDPTFVFHPNPGALEATRAALEADPQKRCEIYRAPWSVTPRALCHRCY